MSNNIDDFRLESAEDSDMTDSETGSGNISYTQLESDTSEGGLHVEDDNPMMTREGRGASELPTTVSTLTGPGGTKVYLVGTAHFSEESNNDVSETIQKVQPDAIMVELCKARIHVLEWDDEKLHKEVTKTMSLADIRQVMRDHGRMQGLVHIALNIMSAYAAKELGRAPGGEFRTAIRECRKLRKACILHLGDRPIHVTLQRTLYSLNPWQRVKLFWQLMFGKEKITQEEVENCKKSDILESMLKEIGASFPQMTEVLVAERDRYLAYSLWKLASQSTSTPIQQLSSSGTKETRVVVGVVGMGHVNGIKEHFGKVTEQDIAIIMAIPQQSMTSYVLAKGFKYSTYGVIAYCCYRYILPKSWTKVAVSSVNQFALKIKNIR